MAYETYKYIIVGAGLAGTSAAKAIREIDKDGSILLAGRECHPPYDRPPLSKDLWFGDKQIEDTFIEPLSFYTDNDIELRPGTTIEQIDPEKRTVTDQKRRVLGFEKLLLATGGSPRRLGIPGRRDPGICYFRSLDDFTRLSRLITADTRALVIGGGFIGTEMAAAISSKTKAVSMLFPGAYPCASVFPPSLGEAIARQYRERDIELLAEDQPVSIERRGDVFAASTKKGQCIEADVLVAGIGIRPEVELAREAGLELEDGIVVDDRLRTSHRDIYAAGDNAQFFYPSLDQRRRVEHWDCASSQGAQAGRNMAGADTPYTSLPYFFSDLFDFGYEAVGDTDPSLEVRTVWETPNEKGIIYYCKDNRVRGVMMCNVWDKVDEARALIQSQKEVSPAELENAIRW